jgi:predicted permease
MRQRRRWFRLPIRSRARSMGDVEAELRAHVDERVERLMAGGMTEEAARAEAERRLGGLERARVRLAREACERDRRLTLVEWVGAWSQDLRFTARSLLRDRGYAAVIVVTLALGIGANATTFGVLDRLLLSGPAEVVDPDRIQRLYISARPDFMPETQTWAPLNYPALQAFREGVESLEEISGYVQGPVRRTLGSGLDAVSLELSAVTASFFTLTGVRPFAGRFFNESEDLPPAGERVLVLAHQVWKGKFGASPDVIGSTVELSGQPYTVIGVAPPGFTGLELELRDGWVPLATAAPALGGGDWATSWGSLYLVIAGRLRPGASAERTADEATAAWRGAYVGGMPAHAEASITVAPIRADAAGGEAMEARVARWLVAVSAIVLLVACANVANLHLARGIRRRREIGVRLALGVPRSRLLRLVLLESVLLAMVGGAAALLVAYWGGELVRGVLLPHLAWTTSPVNARVLAVAAGLTALVGIATGMAPAMQAARSAPVVPLGGSGHGPPPSGRARSVLAVAQAAFSVLLLVGAGLFLRSLWSVQSMDLGLDPDRVLALRYEWQSPGELPPPELQALEARRGAFITGAVERLAALPGVEHASAGVSIPFYGATGANIRADGVDSIPQLPGGGPYLSAVSPDYFATLGTPLLRGRAFEPADSDGAASVVILSRLTARTLWPDSDPIGRCVHVGQQRPCHRVVGVVGDVRRFHLAEAPALQLYIPLGKQPAWMGAPTLLVRSAGDPLRLSEPARRALHGLDGTLRYVQATSLGERVAPQRRTWVLGATLFTLCGALALAIAVIGLYSVIAYMVVHRAHEIGVRMALGALGRDIVLLVMRRTALLAGAGIAVGSALAFGLAPRLQPLLFETEARDLQVLGIVAASLALAALAAGTLPALRASRVPPTRALGDW